MSSHKDNTENRKLKELLNKNKGSEGTPLDDFEKEALEGFATLKNEEEILDLKEKLDTRVYKEVFTRERKPAKTYWYAAAGLLLIIGFSVYFLQNSSLKEREDLAIGSQKAEAIDEIQTVIDAQAQSSKTKEPEFKQAAPAEKLQEAEKTTALENTAYETAPDRKPEKTVVVESYDDNVSAKSAAGYAQEREANEPAATLSKNSEEKKDSRQPARDMKDEAAELDKAPQAEIVQAAPAITAQDQDKLASTEGKRKKSLKRTKAKEGESNLNSYTLAPQGAVAPMPSCYYTGGDQALHKDVKKALVAKNLLQKFDASLYINTKKKVEKVVFTNAYELNTAQQKKITEVLKQLEKFNFSEPSSFLIEYKLVFRP